MNIKNKLFAIGLSVTTMVWLLGGVGGSILPTAKTVQAATIEELQAQINQLLALINSLQAQLSSQGGTPATTYNFTRDLTIGSRGADVTALQQFLKDQGATIYPEGLVTGYFGSLTQAALGKYQAKVGISPTAGYFGPKTRAYINALSPGTPGTPGTPGIPGTGLTASLALDTPAAATIPGGAQGIDFMKFNISGSGTINSITFKRVGPGATADFTSSGVYLFDGVTRLTSGRSINSTTHEVTFTGLSLAISGTKTLRLVANIAAAGTSKAGNQNAFEINSASAISGSETVSGTFPVRSNYMNIAGSDVGSITIATSSLPSSPRVGDLAAKIATLKLTAGATEDIEVRRITLYYAGAVSRSSLSNFVLKQSDATVATASAINSKDLLVLEFTTPFSLDKGTNRIFDLYADIAAGARAGSTETIKFYVEDTGDVYAVGKRYGYGVTVTNSWTTSQSVALDAGQITISFNGPTASDVALRAQDVTLYRFSIKSANRAEFRKLSFTVLGTSLDSGDGFNDFKVVDEGTGAVITSAVDITTSTTATNFTDIFEIAAGQTRNFKVTADVDTDNDANDANDAVKVTLNAFGDTDIKNLDNNTFIIASTDIVPNSAISGNTMTVKTASAEVTLAGDPASKTVTAGTANVDLLGFNFRAVADNIKVTQIVVSASGTEGEISATDVKAALGIVRLFDGSTQIGAAKSFTGSSVPVTATFDNLSYVVNKGDTKLIKVRIDQFSTTASSTIYQAYLAASAFTAQDSDGNTVTISDTVNTAKTVLITVGTPSLTIARVGTGSVDTDAGIVVGGGTRVLGRFSVKATNGDITVKKLQFGVASAALNATSTGLSDDAAGIFLKQCSTIDCSSKTTIIGGTDGLTLTEAGEAAGTVKVENSAGIFTINRGETKYFTVESRLNNVIQGSTEGADSGTSLYASIRLSNFEAVAGNTTLTSYTTSTGGTNLGVTGLQKFVVRSAPTLSVTDTIKDNELATGLSKAIEFTVRADGTDIALKAFGLNITASGATVTAATTSNVTVTDITDGTGLDLTIGSVSGAVILGGSSGDMYIILSSPYIITAGTPKTLRVKVTVASVSATNDASSISTVLDRNTTTQVVMRATNHIDLLGMGGDYSATSTYGRVWVWSDLSDDGAATETETQWTTAGLTRPFPSNNWIVKN